MDVKIDLRVAELLASRLCHDLVGPIGAVNNGMEIIEAMGPEPVFGFVLLGLGEDGHTASLFPGHPAASAEVAPVVAVRGAPKPPLDRVSLTLPVFRRAKKTILLTAGEHKREPLARVLAGDPTSPPGRLGAGLDEVVCDVAAHPG